jgi:hypothetical protein
MLNNECAAAANANLFMAFSTPANNDANEIRIKYGKQILPSATVSLSFSLRRSNPETNNLKNEGKNKMIKIVKKIRNISIALKILDKFTLASIFPFVFRILENRGRKEALNAPSAKILLKVLAIRSATSSASEYMLAPRQNAIVHSRINPISLLQSVKIPTVDALLMIPMFA